MLIRAGVGFGEEENGVDAVKNALEMMLSECNDPDYIFMFSTIHYENQYEEMLRSIGKYFPKKKPGIIGGTGKALIANDRVLDRGVVLLGISTHYVRMGFAIGDNFSKNPVKVSKNTVLQAFDSIKERPQIRYLSQMKKPISSLLKIEPYSLLLFPPTYGEHFRGESYMELATDRALEGAFMAVGRSTPIVGGTLLDDPYIIERSYAFMDEEVHKNALACCAVSSDLVMGYGVAHGYKPTDKAGVVTDASGNLLYEINGEPAAEVIADWFGISMSEWKEVVSPCHLKTEYMIGTPDLAGNYWCKQPGRPLKLVKVPKAALPYVAKVLGTDVARAMKRNPVIFILRMIEGSVVNLVRGTKKDIISAGKEVAEESMRYAEAKKGDVAVAFLFSCAQRRYLLGDDVEKEVKEFRRRLGNVPTVGFYTGGEVGLKANSQVFTANATLTSYIITHKLFGE